MSIEERVRVCMIAVNVLGVEAKATIETELRAAIEQEREECARLCDKLNEDYGCDALASGAAIEIRKRATA